MPLISVGESAPLNQLKDALSSKDAFSRQYLVRIAVLINLKKFLLQCCQSELFLAPLTAPGMACRITSPPHPFFRRRTSSNGNFFFSAWELTLDALVVHFYFTFTF